ncbi:hypothetical protein ABI59_08215 [Acidobacteria bacterium Mor1]|nr:hypothetical protein ABI59_08215 [Acidobacteria bacterium Mor1]
MSGTLYVVATPLGNLEDISPRALRLLREVDVVACEDTRRTGRLLARYEIEVPTLSCHRFNERERLDPILERIRRGERVALVSDGGTPGIADPGAALVEAALEEGLTVSPIPGASAVTTLLSASGMPADRYVFDGFLPHRAGERRRRLRELAGETRTVVVYETPHRIRECLADISEVLGERKLVLGRELTKVHETLLRGSAAGVLAQLGDGEIKGEIALVLDGADPTAVHRDDRAEQVLALWRAALEETGDRRQALRRVAKDSGMKRAELQRYLAELGED